MTGCSVFFVGPMPPPVHGFAEINRRVLARLRQHGNVEVFDVTPRKLGRSFAGISSWLRLLFLFLRFVALAFRGKGNVLYLPLSGGYRQLIDACFAAVAKLCGMRIFVHHHSFAYINREPLYAHAVLRLLRDSTHVVLCERMGELLRKRYRISTDRLRVISNAAFLGGISDHADHAEQKYVPVPENTKLILGFLSNITVAKGCFDFIELVRAATERDIKVEGIMAGPVHPKIKSAFADALQSLSAIKHIGPVYGAAKYGFLEQIDVLVFPSIDEAEPVTIWEAMEAGVPVIALSRGCISGMVPSNAGWVMEGSARFVEQALDHLQYLLNDANALENMKVAARSGFEKARQQYSIKLDDLLLECCEIEK